MWVCDRGRADEAWDYLKRRLKDLGLSESGGVARTKANCLRICEGGPVAVVYPEGTWYAGLDRAGLERVLVEHVLGGVPVEDLAIGSNPFPAAPEA